MTIRESRARLRAAESAYNSAKPGRDLTEARHELTCARGEYQAACVDLVERLPELIEPFALECSSWHASNDDDCTIIAGTDESVGDEAIYNLGDLRRLSSIYKEIADAE